MSLHTGQDLVNTGRSGSVPIMGTFVVNLPLITSTTALYSTAVTLTGITANHAVSISNMGLVSGSTANNSGSTARIVYSVQPQDGQVTIQYLNNAATVNASDVVYSYIATLIKPTGTV